MHLIAPNIPSPSSAIYPSTPTPSLSFDTVPFFLTWSVVNSVAWAYHSTQALPVTTVMLILFIWVISEWVQCMMTDTHTCMHSHTHTHTRNYCKCCTLNSCVPIVTDFDGISSQSHHYSTSYRDTPHHITPHHITSHHITSHHISSHHTAVGFPLTIFGGIFGKNIASNFDAPCRTKNIAREIPSVPWYARPHHPVLGHAVAVVVCVMNNACVWTTPACPGSCLLEQLGRLSGQNVWIPLNWLVYFLTIPESIVWYIHTYIYLFQYGNLL